MLTKCLVHFSLYIDNKYTMNGSFLYHYVECSFPYHAHFKFIFPLFILLSPLSLQISFILLVPVYRTSVPSGILGEH